MITITQDDEKVSWGISLKEKPTFLEQIYIVVYIVENVEDKNNNYFIHFQDPNLISPILSIVMIGHKDMRNIFKDKSLSDTSRLNTDNKPVVEKIPLVDEHLDVSPKPVKVTYNWATKTVEDQRVTDGTRNKVSIKEEKSKISNTTSEASEGEEINESAE